MARFGSFLEKLLEDLEVPFATACAEMDISDKTLWNWRRADTVPQGKAFRTLIRYFVIPPEVFRAAAEGAIELDAQYRNRAGWLIRRAGGSVKDSSSQVEAPRPPAQSPSPSEGQGHAAGPAPSASLEWLARAQAAPPGPEEGTQPGSAALQRIHRRQKPADERAPKPPKAQKPANKARRKKGG